MESDVATRLLAEARRLTPTPVERSRLVPFREALLTFRAKRISYEKIAGILKNHGVTIDGSTVGYYCRGHCPSADIERVRRELISAATGTPAFAAPAAAPAPDLGKRRNPRIARDDL